MKNRLVRMWASESNPRFQVHCLVERDSIYPGTKFGFAAKRRDRMVNLHEYLLRHVFRFWNELPAQNRDREAKYSGTMPANQFCECLLVAVLRAGYELGIALHST